MDRPTRLQRLLGYRHNIQAQLEAYELLLGRKVAENELEGAEEWAGNGPAYPLKEAPNVRFSLNLTDLGGTPFGQYLATLEARAGGRRIGIWTKYSQDCGRFFIRSFREVRFPFPADLDGEVLGFTAEDFHGALSFVWDYEDDHEEKTLVDVTVRGEWADSAIPLPEGAQRFEG